MGRRGCAARESHGNRNLLNVHEGPRSSSSPASCVNCPVPSASRTRSRQTPVLLEECYGKKDPFSSEREKDPPSLPLCSKF